MALTDAISVACKALGVAADIYYANDRTKYTKDTQNEEQKDTRKAFPPQMASEPKVLAWIYKESQTAKANKQRFSVANLLNANYRIAADDITKVASNYENYIITNNLPQ